MSNAPPSLKGDSKMFLMRLVFNDKHPMYEIKQAILAALQETVEESGCKCKCSML